METQDRNTEGKTELMLSIPIPMNSEIEKLVKKNLYRNRQDFINDAIREKILRDKFPDFKSDKLNWREA